MEGVEGKFMIWELLKPYFSRNEKWGDPDKMSPVLLFFLFEFRRTFPDGAYMKINCGWDERTTGGGHPDGRAADVHIVGVSFLAVEARLQSFIKKKGLEKHIALGIYPEWGGGKRPGFHIEVEKEERSKPRRWGAKYKRDRSQAIIFKNGNACQEYTSYSIALNKVKENIC